MLKNRCMAWLIQQPCESNRFRKGLVMILFISFFLKVLAPLEYKNLEKAVSFFRALALLIDNKQHREEHAHWQGKEAHGDLTYTTVI
jgi:hypothetical protein